MSIHIRAAISHNVTLQVMRKSLHSLSPRTLCYDNPLDVQVNGTSLLVFRGISSELKYSILCLLYRCVSVCGCGTVLHIRTALNTKFNKNKFAVFELIHAY
jgi:hypothetical protein